MFRIFERFFVSNPDDEPAQSVRFAKLIPNMLTLCSMAAGLTAIQKAIAGQWEYSVLAILVACILDLLDGAMARLLNAASKFGAELDSLSDFLSFGVAPAMILYLWVLNDAGRLGWMAALIFVMASGLRLARYNAMLEDTEKPEWAKYFFQGVPAPAGAGLALAPMIFAFLIDQNMSEYAFATPLIAVWTMITAALMVGQSPTFSSKQIRLPSGSTIPTLVVVVLIIASLIHAPWVTLSIFVTIYALSVPLARGVYKRRERAAAQEEKKAKKAKTTKAKKPKKKKAA